MLNSLQDFHLIYFPLSLIKIWKKQRVTPLFFSFYGKAAMNNCMPFFIYIIGD